MDEIRSFEEMTWELRYQLASLFLPLYCGLYLTGLAFVSRYKLKREDHEANLATLAARRA